ncbi:SID1 transmembrane family member 1-like [Penaeus monodon]|uniref:SID1 transmembrane family member 1-like n=1 Tax=Penaeus monodon TaxID=6687 RepID=UPI0018A7D65D|nr:SID1 transmembrane family member 1-like [Penaeus monodon]
MARSPSPLPFQVAICLLALPLFFRAEGHGPSHNTASQDWTYRSPHQEGWKKHLVQKNDQKLGHGKVLPLPLIWPEKSKKIHHETPNNIMAYNYPQNERYHNPYLAKPQKVEDQVLDLEKGGKSVVYRNVGGTKSSASRDDNVDEIIHSVVLQGTFGEDLTMKTNKTTEYLIEYLYNATSLKKRAIRVTVSSPESDFTYPVLVVVRQQRGVLSWQLPVEPPPSTRTLEEYKLVSRTLCPVENYKTSLRANHLDVKQRLFVDVSTSSPSYINFTVRAEFENDFLLKLHEKQTFEVTPSTPVFYEFQFPDHVDMILVKANAEDDFCAMVAIQNITCPVFDSEENIKYGNFYQTMTYQAGITIRKENYPKGLYVIVVMLSNDEPCSGSFQHIFRTRRKTVTLSIEEKITKLEYLAAIFAGLGFCAFFYIVTVILACVSYIRAKRKQPRERSLLDDSIITPEDLNSSGPSYGAINSQGREEPKDSGLPRTVSDSSLDEDDIDMLTDAESDKDIFRTKTFLYVSDLARKDMRVLNKKSQLYIWGLLTVGVFYAVPVIQLVITYQKVLDVTGNQDLCYYNFWCAHPLGPLSDFNHVFSNISYILFGILFMGVCMRRSHRHKQAVLQDYKIDKYYGIPQHFGIFYAMGGSLIMEGLLSGCYHICPNNSNYQFDTSFMYVISVMSMLKIYQTRHPDINASASAAFAALALAVVLGVIGVLTGTTLFWVVFGFIHVISCLLLSCNIYYMGRWKCDLGLFGRMKTWFMSELSDWRGMCRPMYCDRMVLLLLGNAANWGLAIYGMVSTPKDFASYLLIIFLTNLLLYIAFYIIMKLRHRERLQLQPLVYLLLCLFGWSAAIFFYVHHTTTWELTPAHSRQFNQECVLLHFYDTHDIWHFFSAAAMFFGFMLLLTLDDDLAHTPREKIPVF